MCRNIIHFLELSVKAMQLLGDDRPEPLGPDKYFNVSDFVLKNAQCFGPDKRVHFRGTIKECFANASRAVTLRHDLTYCEGYALGEGSIPVLHAWVVDKNKQVIECTWSKPGLEYFGIPFQAAFLLQMLKRTGRYGLIDQWEAQWPLLQMTKAELLAKAIKKI